MGRTPLSKMTSCETGLAVDGPFLAYSVSGHDKGTGADIDPGTSGRNSSVPRRVTADIAENERSFGHHI